MPPTSTYRLQLRKEFGFRAAAAVVPYLADLGVSHVYCSPILAAVPGSVHGYDVVDHSRLSPELGGADGWAELASACRRHGLGIVVDVVPNHMALPAPERLNAQLWDVLTHGRASSYADWFDIDWSQHGGKLLMPLLGKPLDECLRDDEITIDPTGGVVRYFDHELPMAPGSASLADQHYLLADWRLANTELNYRRFFDVTALAGLRAELPHVFDATHQVLLSLVLAGDIDGLRIDHPDGLADPAGYLDRLHAACGGRWTVVEKILESGEVLPESWHCDGTTGYDAAAAVTRVLVDPAGERPLTELYTSLTGMPADFDAVVLESKRLAVQRLFGAEVARLVRDLERACAEVPGLDVAAPDAAADVLSELLARFGVYRAYADDKDSLGQIDEAVRAAGETLPGRSTELDVVRRLLRRELTGPAATAFAIRFEQTTGPVMAKGVEDTAFYRYHRLSALNEVGGDPATFASTPAEFHDYCSRLARDWPATMTTLSTHDTKRSEDVRARLLVLAEIPDEWRSALAAWRTRAARHRPPDPNTDYLFWQTLVGTWPITADRLNAYLAKAVKEAKQHTSWTDPDEGYESGLRGYVERVLDDRDLVAEVETWLAATVLEPARSNMLAQKLVQLAMPGVPDVYQGQELPDLSLVDPDNRRPVDYGVRRAAASAVAAGRPVDTKFLVTTRVLRLRREQRETFAGGYTPLTARGASADHCLSFRRGTDVVAVATRLPVGLARRGGWSDTALDLPGGGWFDVLTDSPVRSARVAEILSALPVALLVRRSG